MHAKTILITGGSRGLGRAMAVAMAEKGHRVAVTGRDDLKLAEVARELPGGIAIHADVSDPSHTLAVVDEVMADLGPIDVLINNAGVGGSPEGPQPLVEMNPETWWQVMETNVRGPMLYSHAILPGMIQRGSGVIINMGSYISIRPSPMSTAYASSKAALARLSDCLAQEVTAQGIQVFCVSPGLVLTDMTRDLPFIRDVPDEDFHHPEDIANLTMQLITGDYASLSGHLIHVKDDLAKLHENADRLKQERLYQLSLYGLDGLIR